jgi:phospholipid/cholesterol/gamma-HCH transport system substrate-binding protein
MSPDRHERVSSVTIGAIVAIVAAVAIALAFARGLPFGGGYELKAVFSTSQSIAVGSPVRVAGVEVGEVVDVDEVGAAGAGAGPDGEDRPAALVTMRIDDAGRPIRQDATMELRPRLFLEGNLFVDLKTGSPGAPEAEDGYIVPINQTSVSVQLFDVLGTLTHGVRQDLRVFLDEFGAALVDHGGAKGLNRFYRSSPGAFRYTSQVNEALLGRHRGDLAGVIRNLGRVSAALTRNDGQLEDLVTNLRVVTGSFASEDVALQQAIAELPRTLRAARPAFANLNAAFPSLRSFAREALPGVRSLGPTVTAATPFARQLRLLASRQELGGLARDLRPTVPRLARLSRFGADFLEQGRALASCLNGVVIPWSNDSVDGGAGYPHPAVGPVYQETGYSLVGLAGESRSGDANGQTIRLNAGSGTNVVSTDPEGVAEPFFGLTPLPLLGGMPSIESSAKTPFRPGRPCENQDPPDLSAVAAAPPASAAAADAAAAPIRALDRELRTLLGDAAGSAEGRTTGRGMQRRVESAYARFLRQDFPDYSDRIRSLGEAK